MILELIRTYWPKPFSTRRVCKLHKHRLGSSRGGLSKTGQTSSPAVWWKFLSPLSMVPPPFHRINPCLNNSHRIFFFFFFFFSLADQASSCLNTRRVHRPAYVHRAWMFALNEVTRVNYASVNSWNRVKIKRGRGKKLISTAYHFCRLWKNSMPVLSKR